MGNPDPTQPAFPMPVTKAMDGQRLQECDAMPHHCSFGTHDFCVVAMARLASVRRLGLPIPGAADVLYPAEKVSIDGRVAIAINGCREPIADRHDP